MRQSHVLLIIAYLKMMISRLEAIDISAKDPLKQSLFPIGPQDVTSLGLLPPGIEDSANSQNWMASASGFQLQPPTESQPNLEIKSLENLAATIPLRKLDSMDSSELARFSNFLLKLLQNGDNWPGQLVLIEEENLEEPLDWQNFDQSRHDYQKRSRYFRRNSWKRQSSRYRNNYDYDAARYLCTPTRQDVFELLVALHGVMEGDKEKKVNFCNRWRTAGSIYSNVRFIGRK
ncbi:uncharacterized protein [Prorops nasuta]|uniref:uncharacterized protein n=1 Tax=Prorops nasuta TaxID=863751 RepID=UPI0034CF7798